MTIFHKIINKEIPAYIVYEDDNVLAFLDIFPMTYGHTLVIPKKYSKNLLETDNETLNILMKKSQEIALMLCKKLNADGCNILTNVNEVAQQSIPYTHIHIVPRYKGEYKIFNTKSEVENVDFKTLLEKITT